MQNLFSLKCTLRTLVSAAAVLFAVHQPAQAAFLGISIGPGISHEFGVPSTLGSRVNVFMGLGFAEGGDPQTGTFTATINNDSVFDSGSITAFALSLKEIYFDDLVSVGYSHNLSGCTAGENCDTGDAKSFKNATNSLFDNLPLKPFSESKTEAFDIGTTTGSDLLGGNVKEGIEKGESASFTWTVGLTNDFREKLGEGEINSFLDVITRQAPNGDSAPDSFWVARLQGINCAEDSPEIGNSENCVGGSDKVGGGGGIVSEPGALAILSVALLGAFVMRRRGKARVVTG